MMGEVVGMGTISHIDKDRSCLVCERESASFDGKVCVTCFVKCLKILGNGKL